MHQGMSTRYVVVALMGLILTGGMDWMWGLAEGAQPEPFWQESRRGQVPTVQAPNFTALAEQVKPSVVNISTTQAVKGRRQLPFPFPNPFGRGAPFEDFFERFFGGSGGPQREIRRSSLGSGFIISGDGHIVTNNHVVENATDVKVSLASGEEFEARVVGRDPQTDVALLKADVQQDFPAAPLGSSEEMQAGDWVIAVGNPFGLGHTVTQGIISAKGRVIGAGPYDDFLQTDASINPGNSGGPLFNLNGEVIGINTAIVASGQGIGFAIPIDLAKELLPQLREKGRVVRGVLGVQVQRVTPELAQSLGLKQAQGALVAEVASGGPAARAGVQPGDVIVGFNGEPVETVQELPRRVANTPPGSEVPLTVVRKGQEQQLRVTLGEMGGEEQRAEAQGGAPKTELGLTVQGVTPDIARSLGMSNAQGVVVSRVEEGSPADEAGLQRGDVILEVNQQPVSGVEDYRAALRKAQGAGPVLLLIRRENTQQYVALKPTA